ncbi:MAG: hypothetical protein EPN55_05785 [Gammaproteobacteria bacterium]|nr:MAG: hypothetical protein EPN55_05785 [Gammaproteobacteria bacterium]
MGKKKKRASGARRRTKADAKIVAVEYWGSATLHKRNAAYLLPIPRALARQLGIRPGNVLGMMVVLSDVAPATKGSLIIERVTAKRAKVKATRR